MRNLFSHERRATRGCPARRNVEEPELPNAPKVQPGGEFTNFEFSNTIRIVNQDVTNHVGQQKEA